MAVSTQRFPLSVVGNGPNLHPLPPSPWEPPLELSMRAAWGALSRCAVVTAAAKVFHIPLVLPPTKERRATLQEWGESYTQKQLNKPAEPNLR
ncbi:hypothetical protein J4Q44_G00230050 [Coregonus suidteri]|uniref:Uncharacterized protein n=1 Tax=Coregonus suidteri TaxID=861788 RepID=A0AAN8QJV8_9TELE